MNHLRKTIGWYLLGILAVGIWAAWGTGEGWLFWLMIPVVLWKTPPFSWNDRLFGWASSKDPLGTKHATKKFMDKRGNKWHWWLGYILILWAIISVIVSLISGEPTLVIVG